MKAQVRSAAPREGKHQIVVWMPISLHEQLVELASLNDLSVNAQVRQLIIAEVERVLGGRRAA